jgi:hypothetical protein
MDKTEDIEIRYHEDGKIYIIYRTIRFYLLPADYTITATALLCIIESLVKQGYEERYSKEWGRQMTTPPPPMDFSSIASLIMNVINESKNFSVWQVMFA